MDAFLKIAAEKIIRLALEEDLIPNGDLTASLIELDKVATLAFVSRSSGVIAGSYCIPLVYGIIDPSIKCELLLDDGCLVGNGDVIARVSGSLRNILTGERTALNFLSHLSGVASLTRKFVDIAKAANPNVVIWDTRKTTPGLRSLEKAAVRSGGGANHRGNLSEAVLIKDNHVASLGIEGAVMLAKAKWPGRMIEVECDSLDQVSQAANHGATVIMCDNMKPSLVKEARDIVNKVTNGVLIEVSGGVNLESVSDYALAGADLISIGAITHSAPILDVGLDFIS
ncbi:MAG: carboxylating nicotinate-nucleotide diphosphorylase [Acidimicrobiales bacterium]|nr:carboxylating nicotinate-nucleotide diphosphorylase [Acidimicrobiales bacterium]